MNRLVTDNPQTNTEAMFNLAYVKDKEVRIRGGGDDGEDCTLIDFTNRMCASHDCLFDITPNEIEEEDIDNTGDRLLECSMSGCPIGTAYFIAIQAAELRERVREYEEKDTPKQPVKDKAHPRYGMGYDYYDWVCPNCGHLLALEPNWRKIAKRCCECGQLLKRLTEEEVTNTHS